MTFKQMTENILSHVISMNKKLTCKDYQKFQNVEKDL